MELSEFLEHYEKLVIGDARVAFFQLIQQAGEKVRHTYPCPCDGGAERVNGDISQIAEKLPTGQHNLTLQAVTDSGHILGTHDVTVAGRSQAAKAAYGDAQALAKALQMNVDTAQQQMQQGEASRQAAEERASIWERRCGEIMAEHIQMVDMVNKMQIDRQNELFLQREAEARTEVLKGAATMLLPLANRLGELGAEALEYKVRKVRREWEAEDQTHRTKYEPKPQGDPAPPNNSSPN